MPGILELISMTVIFQKPLKWFVPSYYIERDDEPNGDGWELVRNYRNIKDKEARKFFISTVKELPK